MYEKLFVERLAQLRMQKGVSARDMSLSIGQSATYINKIENGLALPSMSAFFYICEYFGLTPAEFFDTDVEYPAALQEVVDVLKTLTAEQLSHIRAIVKDIQQ
ncbi:MAG: helix-turn-helix transcriptional regulator [Clostridia bacterium]|nr:helix-turn-helix transcriptional regulator [Clostridia bacterium]